MSLRVLAQAYDSLWVKAFLVSVVVTALHIPAISAEEKLPLALPDGVSIEEGDIFRKSETGRRSIALSSEYKLWIDGVVPYQFDPTFTSQTLAAIEDAIAYWNKVGGITFMPIETAAKSKGFNGDSVYFRNNEGCASWVGRQGGIQDVWVGPECFSGSVMHEIGHVLGLEHEHTRPDRDQYISIHWENIVEGKQHNFDIAPESSRALGQYDYGSIMHYGRYNFSRVGEPTLTPIFGESSSVGQRSAPSKKDLNAVADLYATDLSIVTQLFPGTDENEAAIYVDNNLDRGANTIEVRIAIAADSVTKYSDNGWSCGADSEGELLCILDRLHARQSNTLMLNIDLAADLSRFEANVRSKTPDINLLNNSNMPFEDVIERSPEIAAAAAQPVNDQSLLRLGGALSHLFSFLLLPALFLRKCSSARPRRT